MRENAFSWEVINNVYKHRESGGDPVPVPWETLYVTVSVCVGESVWERESERVWVSGKCSSYTCILIKLNILSLAHQLITLNLYNDVIVKRLQFVRDQDTRFCFRLPSSHDVLHLIYDYTDTTSSHIFQPIRELVFDGSVFLFVCEFCHDNIELLS